MNEWMKGWVQHTRLASTWFHSIITHSSLPHPLHNRPTRKNPATQFHIGPFWTFSHALQRRGAIAWCHPSSGWWGVMVTPCMQFGVETCSRWGTRAMDLWDENQKKTGTFALFGMWWVRSQPHFIRWEQGYCDNMYTALSLGVEWNCTNLSGCVWGGKETCLYTWFWVKWEGAGWYNGAAPLALLSCLLNSTNHVLFMISIWYDDACWCWRGCCDTCLPWRYQLAKLQVFKINSIQYSNELTHPTLWCINTC